jgi:hypothetical protein
MACAAGILIAFVLFCVEKFMPGHAPRVVALPGWIGIISFWGFEGERGGVWAWVVFIVVNSVVYSGFALIAILLFEGFFQKRR